MGALDDLLKEKQHKIPQATSIQPSSALGKLLQSKVTGTSHKTQERPEPIQPPAVRFPQRTSIQKPVSTEPEIQKQDFAKMFPDNPLVSKLTTKIQSGQQLTPEEISVARTLNIIKSGDTENRFLSNIKAGYGGMLSSIGGIAQMAGAEKIGQEMQKRGEATQAIWGQRTPNILDDVTQSLPFMLSLVPAMLVGGGMGVGIAAARGVGTLGKAILGSTMATAVSRPIESLLEAGGTYNDARARGLSVEEAEKTAERVFHNNMGLSIMDFAQLGTAFIPAPANVKNTAIKALMAGGGKAGNIARFFAKLGLTGAQEGLEEGIQAKIQTEALGDEFSWTSPETVRAMQVGAVFGAGMGTAGAAYRALKDSTLRRLSPDAQQTYNTVIEHYKSQGMTQEQAELKALNGLADTEEGTKIIQDAVPEAIQTFNQEATATQQLIDLTESPTKGEKEGAKVFIPEAEDTPQNALLNQGISPENGQIKGGYRVVSGTISKPEEPTRRVPLRQRAKAPEVPTDILPGQKYTLKNFGEVEVVDASNLSKVIVRNKRGTEIPIGRKAFENLIQHEEVKAEPPKAEIEETDDIRIIDGEVFYKDKGAATAKAGYAWFSNRKSRFGSARKSVMLPDRIERKTQTSPVDTSTQTPYNDINTIENQEAGERDVAGIQMRNQTSDEEALSRLEQSLRQRTAGAIPEGTRVYELVADEAEGKNKDVQAAREIAKLFGHRFVYFRTNPELKKIGQKVYDTANNFNGANVDGTIVINADRTNPAHAVTGHEIVHEIAKDKEIYEDFINIIKGLTTEEGHAAVKELIDAYNEAGITISEERAWEEFAADFVAEQMTKKEFWVKLAERSPSAVQKAINVIRKIISSLRKKISSGDSVSQFIRDLELAQEIAVDAVAKYLDKTTQKKAESALTEADKNFLAEITRSGTTLATVIQNTKDDINEKINVGVEWLKTEIAQGQPGKRIMVDDPQANFNYDQKWFSSPSTHAKWYRDFWAEHNRKPSNKELREIAEDWLRNGVNAEETYMSAGEDIPPDTEFLELEAFLSELQRIDEAITRGYEEAELAGTQDVRGNQEDIGTGADIRFSAKNKEIGYKESGQLLSVEEQLSFSFNTQVKKTLDQLEFNFPEIKGKEATRDAAKAIVEIQQQQKEGSDLSDQRGEVDRDRKHSGSRIKTVARDYARKLLNKGRISFVGKRIKSPEELAIMAQVLRDPRFETFRIFFTRTLQDGSKEIVWHTGVTSKIPGTARVSVGDTAQERADWINNTFRQGAFHNADGYFFMHNHPTGDPKPSKQDLNVSEHFFRSIKGLNFEGHIIINSNRYSFISPDDVIAKKYGIFILPNITKDALLTPDKPHPLLGKIPVDASGRTTSASMAALVYQHKAPKGFSVLFYFSPKFKVRGIQEVPSINFSDEKKFKSWLRNQAIEFGGQNVVLVAENDDVFNYAKTLIKDNYFLDVINMSGGRSAQEMGFTPSGEDIWMGKKEKGIETWEERMKYLVAGQPLFQLKVKGGRWAEAEKKGLKKQEAISDIEAKLGQQTDAEIGDTSLSKLGVVHPAFTQGMKLKEGELYTPEDPEIARRFKEAKGVRPETIIPRLRAGLEKLKNQMTREFEHLPRTAEFSKLRFALSKLQKQKDVASDKAFRVIQGLTIKFNPEQYDLFCWKVVMDDLMEDYKNGLYDGKEMPFGFTAESLEKESERLNAVVEATPDVKQAVEQRKQLWQAIKRDYTSSMKAIGFDVTKRLGKEDYFRHQVLAMMDKNRAVKGTGKKLKTPTGRGFLKKREGSSLDYNTEYIQAEYEVMAQMLYDIEVVKTIKLVDNEYNILNELKAEALRINDAKIMPFFQELADQINVDPNRGPQAKEVTAESMYRQILNKKQAIGFSKLGKAAAEGNLPDNGKWTKLIDALAENYYRNEAEKARAEEMEEPFYPKGLSDELHAELMRYAAWLLKEHGGDSASGAAAMIFKGIREKKQFIKETLGDRYVTWQDLIPEGYELWQPREGTSFYMADTIPAQKAERLFAENLEQLGIAPEEIKKVLAKGQMFKEFVIKEEVASTLNNLVPQKAEEVFALEGMKKAQVLWKVWTLVSPRRWFKYNARNLTGDADALFAGNPSAFKKVPQAINELLEVYKGKSMPENMKDWFERGGKQTLLQAQELGDINKLKIFQHMLKQADTRPAVARAWEKYWRTARLTTDFREGILRYAAYLDYLEQMKNNKGRPKNFGASIPEEVMALDDIKDRAFKLSNELLGAYDQVSVTGQWLREHMIPFWSWNEVNAKRYMQLVKNAARDDRLCEMAGRKLLTGVFIRSPLLAIKIGKFAIKASALWLLLALWNESMFPDEEERMSDDEKRTPHIILGKDENGDIIYFSRLGALPDFLEWFGIDSGSATDIQEVLNGQKSVKELATEMAKAPVNKVAQGINPFMKSTVEVASGKKFFPDLFKPGQIRDKGLYFAQSLGLDNEYRAVMDLPSKPYRQSLKGILVYTADPEQNAYWDALDYKYEYLKKIGKGQGGAYQTSAKSNALYNYKLALRYEDKKAAEKYLNEYIQYGGTGSGLKQSLRAAHPLYGLGSAEKDFLKQLDSKQKYKLEQAIKYYQETFLK